MRVRQRRWNVLSSLLSASAFGLRNRRRPVAVAVVVTTVVTAVVAAVVEAGIVVFSSSVLNNMGDQVVIFVASSVLYNMGDQVVRPPSRHGRLLQRLCTLDPRFIV